MKPVMFTSIAPANIGHQLSCLESWLPHVAGIVSVNHASEKRQLGTLPGWIENHLYEEAGIASLHVPLQRIGAAMQQRMAPDDPVILTNSDIHLEGELTTRVPEDGLSFQSRIDLGPKPGARSLYDEGFDLFCFRAGQSDLLPGPEFKLGLPWWDFFLPINFLRQGRPVRRLSPGSVCHRAHPQNWDMEAFVRVGNAFMQTLFPHCAKPTYDRRQLLQLCGKMRALLVSGPHGQLLAPAALRALNADLEHWHRRAVAGQLPRRLNIGQALRNRRRYRFRCRDGRILPVYVKRPVIPRRSTSTFVFGMHRGGSTILHRLTQDLVSHGRILDADVPGQMDVLGHHFFEVEQDLDGLFEQPGYCFRGFRTFPRWLRHSEGFNSGSKFLLIRDPRDMLVSMYFRWALDGPTPLLSGGNARETIAQTHHNSRLEEYVIRQAACVSAEIDNFIWMMDHQDSLQVMRYEDIVFDKDSLLTALCDLLGVSISPRRRRHLIDRYDVRPDREDAQTHIRKVTPGDHREKLSPQTIDELNRILARPLRLFGYAVDNPRGEAVHPRIQLPEPGSAAPQRS